MNREALYSALSRVAWGYFFLRFNVNLGTINLLPDWVCYALVFGAIALLSDAVRDLPLLRPFCILLGVWEGACWLLSLASIPLSGTIYLLELVLAAVSVYFHFQLLTDMALLAERYQEEGQALDKKLRRGRSLMTVLTALLVLPLPWARLPVLPAALACVSMGVAIYLMYLLFTLRRCFAPEPEGAE